MNDALRQRQQHHATHLVVRHLQPHWSGAIDLAALALVLNAVASYVGLDEVVMLCLGHLELEIIGAVDLPDYGFVREDDGVCTGLGPCETYEDGPDNDGVQEVRKQRLHRENDGALPAAVEVRVWHTVSNRHRSLQREVVRLHEAAADFQR